MDLHYSYPDSPLEVRQEGDSHYIEGVVASYGQPSTIANRFVEVFQAQCFRWDSVMVLRQHDRRLTLGRTGANAELRDGPDALRLSLRLVEGSAVAQEVYALARAGVLTGLSPGFIPVKTEEVSGAKPYLRVIRADLREISLVDQAAHKASRIESVRNRSQPQGIKIWI